MAKSRKGKAQARSLVAAPQGAKIHGPKKARSKIPRPRTTTHKARSVWFAARVTWPLREAMTRTLVQERARATSTLPPHDGATEWELVGPTNVGGRTTSIVCAPDRVDTIIIGAAGGGIWKSNDAGQTWRSLWHKEPTLNIGALAIDPGNSSTIYCGTGEANLSADSYPGVGVYRSLDGGETWQLLAPADSTGIPTRIGCIAVDPFDSAHIVLGGVKHDFAETDGMFVSRDGGLSWGRNVSFTGGAYRCHAVLFHPTTRDTLLATITARGTKSGIWKSTDGGATWTHLTNGLPPSSSIFRTSLALAPSNPDIIYAIASDRDDFVLGVFKTTNGGASWTNVAGTHFRGERQMSYGNTIVVHPTNSNHVLCGGVDLHRTSNGGATWRRVTRWDANRGASNYAHADHHGLLMPAAQPGLVYDVNDGGLDVSLNGGTTWRNRSNGLATTMFYDADVAQTDSAMFGGGAQDNGTNVTFEGKPDEFFEVSGGDGGWMIIDPRAAGHFYTTWQGMGVVRFRGNNAVDVSPPAPESETSRVWMAILDIDPSNSRRIFLGGLRIWRTTNDAASWSPVSPILDGSQVSAVEIAQTNVQRVYVGTENGGIFRSLDGGDNWSGNLAGPLPGLTVTRLITSPDNADILYATVANFGTSHVFRSDDGGDNWSDIDGGELPDVPHHAIAIPTQSPTTLYVANDAGVFISEDDGVTWENLTRNLPTSPIVDLVLHEADNTLMAATYGRSLWRLQL